MRVPAAARPRHHVAGHEPHHAGRTGTPRPTARFASCAGAASTVFVMGLSMGGSLTLRLAEEHGDDIAGHRAGQPGGAHASDCDRSRCCRCSSAFVASFPGISQRHREARPGRGRLRQDPAEGRPLAVAAVEAGQGRHRARSPRRCCCSAARARTTSSSRPTPPASSRNVAQHRRHRGRARGQLPRRHARQRRPADLRPRASSSCTDSRRSPRRRVTLGAMTTPNGRDNGLPPAPRYVALVDVDPPVADHVLELLRDAGVTAVAEPLAGDLGPARDTPPPTRPTDRVHVDEGHLLLARTVVGPGPAGAARRLPRRRRPPRRHRGVRPALRPAPRRPAARRGRHAVRRHRRRLRPRVDGPGAALVGARGRRPTPPPVEPGRRSRRGRRCRRGCCAAAPTRRRPRSRTPTTTSSPPPPPPLPEADRVTRLAWAGAARRTGAARAGRPARHRPRGLGDRPRRRRLRRRLRHAGRPHARPSCRRTTAGTTAPSCEPWRRRGRPDRLT